MSDAPPMHGRSLIGATFLLLACAGAKTTTKPVGVSPAASVKPSASAVAGSASTIAVGRAKLTPLISDAWEAFDAIELDPGRTLYVGAAGQRWLAVEKKEPTKDDPDNTRTVLTGATSMAPETLIAVRKRADGTFLFVGESGATYAATNALADLTTRRMPPEPLRPVAAGKDAILGVTKQGTILRSIDGGATFAPVTLPKSETVPTQLVGGPRAEVLVLSSPGKLFASVDDGGMFREVKTAGVGPTALFVAANGTPFVHGYTVSPTKPPGLASLARNSFALTRTPDGTPQLEKAKGSLVRVSRPMADEDRLELAEGIRNGHAVLDGLRYLEVRASEDGETLHAITLEKGAITHHPAIAATKNCELAHVTTSAAGVELLCTKSIETKKDTYEQLQLFKSTDFGKTFAADGTADAGEGPRRVFVGATGHVIIVGGCSKAHCTDDPILVRPASAKTFVAAKVPAGFHLAPSLLVRVVGDRVFAIATNEEQGGLHLLSSKDAGKTFAARPLPQSDDRYLDDIHELAFDEKTGVLSLFASGEPVFRLTTKDDGATWDARELPFGADWISIAGARGLATLGNAAYETLDGGNTFGVVSLPASASVGGTLPIVCSEQGCMIGDLALREGWELATAADVKLPQKPDVTKAPAPKHLPLLECTTDGSEIELGAASEPIAEPSPGIAFATAVEAKGGIELVTWPRASKSIVRTQLLGASKSLMATRRIQNGDGIVVLRAPREGDPKTMVDVELAWWVASTGKVHHATLPKAVPPLGKWGSINATIALAPGFGVYARVASGIDAPTFLAREAGSVTKLTLPAGFPALQRMFARRVGTATMFVGAPTESAGSDRIAAFVLLPDNKNDVTPFTWGLWPRPSGGRSELALGDPLVVTWQGSETIAPKQFALSLKDAGPEPPEPTALPATLPVCDSKATGSRLEVAWTNGARTPIIVKFAGKPRFHATSMTIARSSKTTCASGLLAGSPTTTGNEWTILDADATHGFFIARTLTHVAVPLTCTKSSAPLPPQFAHARGFGD